MLLKSGLNSQNPKNNWAYLFLSSEFCISVARNIRGFGYLTNYTFRTWCFPAAAVTCTSFVSTVYPHGAHPVPSAAKKDSALFGHMGKMNSEAVCWPVVPESCEKSWSYSTDIWLQATRHDRVSFCSIQTRFNGLCYHTLNVTQNHQDFFAFVSSGWLYFSNIYLIMLCWFTIKCLLIKG